MKKHLAWSYSRLMDYEKCPQLFKYKVLDKLPEPSNEYMERGQDIHSKAEQALLRPKTKVPRELMRFKNQIETLRRMKAVPEVQHAFTYQFKDTTDWFAKDTWARVKIDVEAALTYKEAYGIAQKELHLSKRGQLSATTFGLWIVDWKSGQFKPEKSVDQLELYALSTFLQNPAAEFVLTTLAYTDIGRSAHSYWDDPKAVKPLKAKWLRRVEPMQKDAKFKPKPGAQCKWCHFRKSIGGPCKYGAA